MLAHRYPIYTDNIYFNNISSEGGKAPHDERGLEAADEETRERVAREGGKASSGGGRKKE